MTVIQSSQQCKGFALGLVVVVSILLGMMTTSRAVDVTDIQVTPVKVNLFGKDAALNSDDHFLFDLDGFKTHKVPLIETAGGINADEAWLVTDRSGDGFFIKEVMDGDDVFGDHLGKYRSGYDDLEELYAHQLQKDEADQRYIPLKSMPWWKRFWVWFTRLLGFHKHWDASYDLLLLKRDRTVIPARDVLTRVYVDYRDVDELDDDKLNWIRQRAPVHYKAGQIAQSADQWFQALVILKQMAPEDVKHLEKKKGIPPEIPVTQENDPTE